MSDAQPVSSTSRHMPWTGTSPTRSSASCFTTREYQYLGPLPVLSGAVRNWYQCQCHLPQQRELPAATPPPGPNPAPCERHAPVTVMEPAPTALPSPGECGEHPAAAPFAVPIRLPVTTLSASPCSLATRWSTRILTLALTPTTNRCHYYRGVLSRSSEHLTLAFTLRLRCCLTRSFAGL